jgi:hypothetical protein
MYEPGPGVFSGIIASFLIDFPIELYKLYHYIEFLKLMQLLLELYENGEGFYIFFYSAIT